MVNLIEGRKEGEREGRREEINGKIR